LISTKSQLKGGHQEVLSIESMSSFISRK
jgi:hypothetical protein